jgi:hypothetical protein
MIGDALSDAKERILDYLEKYDYTDMRPQIAAALLVMDKLREDLDSKGMDLIPGAVTRSFPTDPLAYLDERLAERAAERKAPSPTAANVLDAQHTVRR